ncbi:hypothetical protein [Glutamicibacter ardleyensis]|uniref:hypothetical protein n=1 Tax=Glutamicibacter ardleyensis TaxID=225894 RepID=UPI003FD2DD4A
MKPQYFSTNTYKDFDHDALTASAAINSTLRITPTQLSAEAFNLNTYLATWWNAQSGTGSVHPSVTRISKSLGLNEEQQELALRELEEMGWWKVVRSGNQKEYKFLLALDAGKVRNDLSKSGGVGISMNHTKFVARYTQCSPMAKALMLHILSISRQTVVKLDYKEQINAGRYGRRTKLFHGVLFTSPHVDVRDPRKHRALAKLKNLPEEWTTAKPVKAHITLENFNRKVACTPLEWNDAITEVRERGLWTAFIDPFTDTDTHEAVFTPTFELHNMVWKFDQIGGGGAISEFEALLGFDDTNPDSDELFPELGYHFVYTLRNSKGRVLMVGQTTQPLTRRLNQHLTEATNTEAMRAIKVIVQDPDDSLEIVHEATVHFSGVAKYEVELMQYYTIQGETLFNVIRTVEENRRTIKPDARFGVEGVSQKQLDSILNVHGGKVVLDEPGADID